MTPKEKAIEYLDKKKYLFNSFECKNRVLEAIDIALKEQAKETFEILKKRLSYVPMCVDSQVWVKDILKEELLRIVLQHPKEE